MRSEFVCVATDVVGFSVHWLGNRSYMCPGVGCPACFSAVGARWLGILPIRWSVPQSDDVRYGFLELSSGTYERFDSLRRMLALKSFLGLPAVASRSRDRSSLRCEPGISDRSELIEVKAMPDWMARDAIATLYSLPSCHEEMSVQDWEAAAMPKAMQLIRVALPRAVATS